MNLVRRKTIFAGLLLLGSVFAGIFSVSLLLIPQNI